MADTEKDGGDERIKRIKFLVEQSKLYSQFLASAITPAAPSTTNSDTKQDQSALASEPLAKKPRRSRSSAKASNGKQQPITNFFKPPPTTREGDQPKSVVVPLHPHQISALKWLAMLYQNGLNGILADEMGLGKTLEVIAFICFLLENGVSGHFLVLAPLSTLGNWCSEITRFAPSLSFTKYYGNKQERSKLRTKHQKWGRIVLTSYEIVMADAAYLQRIDWKYIIVDEGHRIKNIDSKLMRTLKKFTSANRMLLTGTPLQNNLTELWALLNFLMPDIFTDLDIFHSWFESGEANITENDESGLVTSLHDILRPFLLRRLKRDVGLNLPPKKEFVIFNGLTEVQQSLYHAFLKGTAREFVIDRITQERYSNGDDKDQLIKQARRELRSKSFSNLIMQLRLTCDSPHLFWYAEDSKDLEMYSGKLQLLHRLMTKLRASGHKVLVFTQFTKMLDILEDWAIKRGYKYCRLDGTTPQEERQTMIESFTDRNSEHEMFFLTTRSGGQGINLVGADTVVLFDSDWNPQQDLQAMDRVHRIGQTQPILVFRLCTGDTVEQDILERVAQKLELNHLVIESGQFKGPTLSKETTSQKIMNMDRQLQEHRVKFTQGATFQITDADLDKILDRSPEAYASKDTKVSDYIYCVKTEA